MEAFRILGTTLDARTGEQLEGVSVLGPEGIFAVSGPGGRFLLEEVPSESPVLVAAYLPDGRMAELRPRPPFPDQLEVVLFLAEPDLAPGESR